VSLPVGAVVTILNESAYALGTARITTATAAVAATAAYFEKLFIMDSPEQSNGSALASAFDVAG